MSNFGTLVSIIIQAERHGQTHELKRVLEAGATPRIMIAHAGFSELDMVIKASTIAKICFDHGIGTHIIQRIPDILGQPKALYQSATNPESCVVMTYEYSNACPIVMALQKNRKVGWRTCNVIASMYGKQAKGIEARWKSQGLLLWEAQKKAF